MKTELCCSFFITQSHITWSTAKFSNDVLPVNPLEEEQTKNPPKAGSQRPEPATAGSAHS